MASHLPLTVVKRRAAEPKLPAIVLKSTATLHSTASALGKMLHEGGLTSTPILPQPMAVLTPQKPWVKDKADLTVYNAVFNISGGPVPTIILTPGAPADMGSVEVYVRNASAGKMYVIEFIGNSQTGNDFAVSLGPTLHVTAGDYKLPIVITPSGTTGYCRISAKNFGPPNSQMAVRVDSVKVWAVN